MKRVILATVSHRSGSPQIGEIISSEKGVSYILEPFDMIKKIQISPLKYWFENISKDSNENTKEWF